MSAKQLEDAIASYKKRKAAGKTKREVRESDVEAALCARVKDLGGIPFKFVSPQRRGSPDRLVLLPEGRIAFVELKRPGEKPTDLQRREHDRIRQLGFRVDVVDNMHDAKTWNYDIDSLNLF